MSVVVNSFTLKKGLLPQLNALALVKNNPTPALFIEETQKTLYIETVNSSVEYRAPAQQSRGSDSMQN